MWKWTAVCLVAVVTCGCQEGTQKKVAEQTEQAGEQAKDAAVKAGEQARDMAKKAGEKVGDAAEKTGDFLWEQSAELRTGIDEGLSSMQPGFEKYSKIAEEKSVEGWDTLKTEYTEQREVLAEKMEDWKAASGDQAADARAAVQKAWENLKETYAKIVAKFSDES